MTDFQGSGVGRPARVMRPRTDRQRLDQALADIEDLQMRVKALEDGTNLEYKPEFKSGFAESAELRPMSGPIDATYALEAFRLQRDDKSLAPVVRYFGAAGKCSARMSAVAVKPASRSSCRPAPDNSLASRSATYMSMAAMRCAVNLA